MAERYLNIRVSLKNDTAANFVTKNPVLLKAEMGVEIDTGKFKFGDGVKEWNELKYASAQSAVVESTNPTFSDVDYDIGTIWVNTSNNRAYVLVNITDDNAMWQPLISAEDLESLGSGDMLMSKYATNVKSSSGYVDKSIVADKLTSPKNIGITGDVVSNTVSFDGSEDVTLSVILPSLLAAGTGIKITVNDKGIVTAFEGLSEPDIPMLTMAKISDAGTAATKNVGLSVGNVVVVNEDGKLDASLMPSLVVTDVFSVESESEMLALDAQQGDLAIRVDERKCYILKTDPASVLSNWMELIIPLDAVLSVNGKIGTVILTTDDVAESVNLYYTEARATSNFNANFALKTSIDLLDGNKLLKDDDVLILNGGTASGW